VANGSPGAFVTGNIVVRLSASDKLENNAAEGPNVRFWRDDAFKLLRAHIWSRAIIIIDILKVLLFVLKFNRKTKIYNFNNLFFINYNIIRFQISMNNSFLLHMSQSCYQLTSNVLNFLNGINVNCRTVHPDEGVKVLPTIFLNCDGFP
jgi:hypothetical protein